MMSPIETESFLEQNKAATEKTQKYKKTHPCITITTIQAA